MKQKKIDSVMEFTVAASPEIPADKRIGSENSESVDGYMNWLLSGAKKLDESSNAAKELDLIAERIFSYLNSQSLAAAELVCKNWYRVISVKMLWRKVIERKVRSDLVWHRLAERRGWIQSLLEPLPDENQPNRAFYRKLFSKATRDIENLDYNWRNGTYTSRRISNGNDNRKCIGCLQYDDRKIISGVRDNSIKIWDRETLECAKELKGHTAGVQCLQFDDKIVVSGSSDSTVRVWDAISGDLINTLTHHSHSVAHLKFKDGILVTGSRDCSIAVWDITLPTEIQLLRVLSDHQGTVYGVDFDEKYIVSASNDRKIKVWNMSTGELVRTLSNDTCGIFCVEYRHPLIVSGSDKTIRLWDVESGVCLRTMWHERSVNCVRFDNKYIVSGSYDGIKIWDLMGALDSQRPSKSLCLRSLTDHSAKVVSLQFDEFQIISSAYDGSVIIRDFLTSDNNESANDTTADQSDAAPPSR